MGADASRTCGCDDERVPRRSRRHRSASKDTRSMYFPEEPPAPPSPRPRDPALRKLWREAFDAMFVSTQGAVLAAVQRMSMMETGQTSPEDVQRFLRMRMVSTTNVNRIGAKSSFPHRVMRDVWDKYDVDGSGTISRRELRVLLEDFLYCAKEYASTDAALLWMAKITESGKYDTKQAKAFLAQPSQRARLLDLQERLEGRYEELLLNLDELNGEIFRSMDTDGSKSVDKAEYINRFGIQLESICSLTFWRAWFLHLSATQAVPGSAGAMTATVGPIVDGAPALARPGSRADLGLNRTPSSLGINRSGSKADLTRTPTFTRANSRSKSVGARPF